jgi:hypothetical protein
VFVVPNGTEAVAISLWESKENADTYKRATYPEVQKTLTNLAEGTPDVPSRSPARHSTRSPLAWPPKAGRFFLCLGAVEAALLATARERTNVPAQYSVLPTPYPLP